MITQSLAEKELKRESKDGKEGLKFITTGYKNEMAKNLEFKAMDEE